MSFLTYLRQQADLPPHLRDPLPPEETLHERMRRQEDLERRIDADIAASQQPAKTVECPACRGRGEWQTGPHGEICRPCDGTGRIRVTSEPRESHGVIHFPQAMLDAFGLTEIDCDDC